MAVAALGVALAGWAYARRTADPLQPIAESVARRRGWNADELRVTSRSELATSRHAIYRITRHHSNAIDLTLVVANGRVAFDSETPGAFERLMREERGVERLHELGASRVAAWYAAFGDGTCGAPEAGVTVDSLAEGGARLRYAFVRHVAPATRATCVLELRADGSVARVVTE